MQIKFTELTDSQWQIIEKFLSHHQPRKHDLRVIMNAILWITRTGAQWRNLESKYPKWESVYYYFSIWRDQGILKQILRKLVEYERVRRGRNEKPSAAAVDSQSVRMSLFMSEAIGVDGGKKVNGRKRHLLVDTLGLPIAIHVTAANIHDGKAGDDLLAQTDHVEDVLKLIRADSAYAKEFKESASWFQFEVEITQKPESTKGFVPQKGRWQVERSFAWMNIFRRLSRDFEKLPQSSVAFIQLMFITIILSKN
jgi:putative transposase